MHRYIPYLAKNAGFDKITKLTEETASSSGNNSTGSGASGAGGFTLPSIGDGLGQQETAISSTLATIMGIAGGALVAIGLILIATSNIAWGVGFIIAGALTLGVSMAMIKDTQISDTVRNSVTKGIVIAGLFALVVGLLLCAVPSKLGYGLALVALGAASLVGAVVLNWNGIKEMLQGKLGAAIAIAGVVAIVIGILLCVAQHWAIGLALIAVGGVALAAPIAANWNVFLDKIKGIWGGIKTYWSGKIAPWFTKKKWQDLFAKVISGFSSSKFVTRIKEICEAFKTYYSEKIKPWFTKDKWKNLFGKILSAFSSTEFVNKIKGIYNAFKLYYDEKIKPWFTKEKWQKLAASCGDGLKSGFKNAINSIIGFFETLINRVIDKFNKISFKVPDWIPSIGGKKYGVNISKVSIPRLAQGAVIPPNREFLAVLGDQKSGTNIETPLKTMIEAFNVALDRRDNISGDQTIVVTLDGEVLFRNTIKKNKNYILATGVSPLGI
jgi:hypothetical protein